MLEEGSPQLRGTRARAAALVLASALLLSSVVVLAIHNLGYAGMWWDEAAQFWISQGLSNYSPPFAESKSVRDVLRMNRLENLDPGGFSVLLHAWTALGRGLAWLRSLPLAFFALGVGALGLLGWRLTRSALFALAASAVPSLYPAVLYFGLEIRAYSMEMAGLAIGVFALVVVQERPSLARASLLGLACAAFLTSRYSFILVTLALAAALWQGCAPRASRSTRTWCMFAFLLPAFAAGLGIWWVTLGHQLVPGMKSGPLGVASPAYTRAAVLGPGTGQLALVGRNLLSPEAMPITACVLIAVLLRRRAYASLMGTPNDAELKRSRSLFTMLYTFIVGLQAISAGASALGMYPWDITTRWSAYLVMLSAVAVVVLTAETRSLVLARLARRGDAGVLGRYMQGLAGGLALLVVIAASGHSMLHRQSVEGPHRTNVALQLDQLSRLLPAHSVFVAFYEVPMVRYLYEYGPYAGRPEYPRIFRFETTAEWHAKVPIAARAEGIAFIVSALPIAEAQARFPGFTLRPCGPDGTRLLAVSTPAGSLNRPHTHEDPTAPAARGIGSLPGQSSSGATGP